MSEPDFFDTPIAFITEHIGNLQQVLREGRKPTYAEVILVKNLKEHLPELFKIATEDCDENGIDACLLAKQQLPIIVAGFMQSCGIDPTPVLNPGTDDAAAKAAVLRLMASSMQDAVPGELTGKLAKSPTTDQEIENRQQGEDAFAGPTQLAEMFDRKSDPVRKRLDRWRNANFGKDWMENPDANSRSPRFLYRISAVKHIVLKAPKR